MDAEQNHPSLAEQLTREAASRAALQLARQALTKAVTVIGTKAGAIAAVVIAVIILIVLLIMMIVAVAGAAFQSSTAVWPVSVKTDTAGNYQASGWTISSRFGWRDEPLGSGAEFHDGLDLANPNGTCPFGYHCGAPSMFDGQVTYVGWDQAASGDPSKTGGGEMVMLQNGQADHQTIYAHLEPYRLYVQLQGRIDDDYGRYDDYRTYQPIGHGSLRPDLANGSIEMTCLNDMPNFIPTRSGPGTVVFLYDRPASCVTTVVWGMHGGDWQGWIPDQPSGHDGQRADLNWQTPIDLGKHAQDVALRFRAHLVPPPPPPTPTETPAPKPSNQTQAQPLYRGVVQRGRGSVGTSDPVSGTQLPTSTSIQPSGKPNACISLAGGWSRCRWDFANIPSERERFATEPNPWVVAAAPMGDMGQVSTATLPLNSQTEDDAAVPTMSTALPNATPTSMLIHAPRSASVRVEPSGVGGLEQRVLAQESTPTPTPIDNAISIVAVLPDRLLLHSPDSPDHLGPSLTLTSDAAEQVQITISYEEPAIPGPGDTASHIINLSAGTLANYAPEHMGFTVPSDTAPSVQVCLNFAWQGLKSGATGSTRACTVTADPLAASPTTPIQPPPVGPGGEPGNVPNCESQPLARLPNVTAPQPKLVASAAASFADVRAEVQQRTGIDALAVLADVLRAPSFTTDKPGVLDTSWHKAGRAVDLNQGGPFVRVAEGNRFRLFVNNVDITAVFEAHGWQRIPVQAGSLEWWHYEWHPDGIAWTSAMMQVWDLRTLQAAFPTIAWTTIGCQGGTTPGSSDPTTMGQESEDMCILGAPTYGSSVETVAGCGPPIRVGDTVYQLDSTLGFVGLTGHTTGPHLHLGLKVKSYDGTWPMVDICTPEWLQGRTPPTDINCFTEMADPLAFLPQAPGNVSIGGKNAPMLRQLGADRNRSSALTPTPLIPEGAPYQLPPPNYPGALVFTPIPAATPVGQYWSPYADGGRYGGGEVGQWFCANVWNGFPWCN